MLDRKAALDLIVSVLAGSTWDKALSDSAAFNSLVGRDRGFAYWLAAGTLRHYNILNPVLKKLTGKKMLNPPELSALCLMGLAQIFFLDVAEHAAVNTAVDLAETRQKGLVNAVLRRALREKDTILNDLSLETNALPHWMFEQLKHDHGEEKARVISLFSLEEPALDITFKTPHIPADAGILQDPNLRWDVHSFGSLRVYNVGNVTELPGYDSGDWWVQDAAASLPVRTLGDLTGKTALDMCAAPGGKTLQMAAAGAHVIALDLSDKRLIKLVENAQRCGLEEMIEVDALDARHYETNQKFDVILLDAPCSATGTIRRHPDMWVQAKPRPLENFIALQKTLLDKAVTLLADDGVLLYATCSLNRREGEIQRDMFLQRHKDFKILPEPEERPNRIFPHEFATDGFFFCRFARES